MSPSLSPVMNLAKWHPHVLSACVCTMRIYWGGGGGCLWLFTRFFPSGWHLRNPPSAPPKAITGGPWYTDQQFDYEFVRHLSNYVLSYVKEQVYLPVCTRVVRCEAVRRCDFGPIGASLPADTQSVGSFVFMEHLLAPLVFGRRTR